MKIVKSLQTFPGDTLITPPGDSYYKANHIPSLGKTCVKHLLSTLLKIIVIFLLHKYLTTLSTIIFGKSAIIDVC